MCFKLDDLKKWQILWNCDQKVWIELTEKQSKMSLYELEGIPKAYSIQAQEIQKGRDAKVQHLLAQVSFVLTFIITVWKF